MSRPRMKFLARDCKDNVKLSRAEAKKVLRNRFPTASDSEIDAVLDEVYTEDPFDLIVERRPLRGAFVT